MATKTTADTSTVVIFSDIKVEDVEILESAQKVIRAYRRAKEQQSKGRTGETKAVKELAAIMVQLDTKAISISDALDGVTFDAAYENKTSNPAATAWNAYLASLSDVEAKAAKATFFTPHVKKSKKLSVNKR